MRRVEARKEWGVKLYAAGNPSDAEGSTDVPTVGAAAGPGAAYLRRRRGQLSAQEEARRAVVRSAEDIHAILGRLAEAAKLHAPQDPQLTGDAGWTVLNAAYLVKDERAGDFTGAIKDLADRHHQVRFEVTGPWPPYSFAATLEEIRA